MYPLLFATLFLTATPGTAPKGGKPKAPPTAEALLERVQRYYDQTQELVADFTQTYTRVALSKTSESRGVVRIKKPGMMRWEYTKPAEKLFVADGQQLWIYEPEEQQVIHDAHFKASELTSSIRFLWGEGKLKDAFTVKASDEKPAEPRPNAMALELTPKSDATYSKLILIVDSETGQALESVLHETSGNVNHFVFHNTKANGPSLKKELFTFTPPKGVDVVERP